MKRAAAFLLALLALAMTGIAFADTGASGEGASDGAYFTALDQLSDKRIGVSTGSVQAVQVGARFPDA